FSCRSVRIAIVIGILAAASAFAATNAININFASGRTQALQATNGTCGYEPFANWNNITGITGTNIALTDANGTASGADITFTGAATTYSVYAGAGPTPDAQMVNAYIDTNATFTTL